MVLKPQKKDDDSENDDAKTVLEKLNLEK